jgi:hypothetical protein
MAYQLQPGLTQIDSLTIPKPCADDFVFEYAKPSSLNLGSRPQTMLYGTAPYFAGKGAPAELVDVSDELRPQTTAQFKKIYVDTLDRNTFPWQNVSCMGPVRSMQYEPASTRAELQNGLFMQRYSK